MGAFHSGFLDHIDDFKTASGDPDLSEMLGCFKPSLKAPGGTTLRPTVRIVIKGTEWRFYRHPELYLLPHICTLIAEQNYNENTGRVVPFDTIPAWVRDAKNVYDQALTAFRKQKEAVKI